MKRLRRIALGSCVVALTGCGSGGGSPSSAVTTAQGPPVAPKAVRITMRSLAFTPAELAAAVGQTVIWRNDDTAAHNVTYVSGPRFVSSATMRTGASYRIKLTRAGTIQYYCTIHPFMTGTIAVLPR